MGNTGPKLWLKIFKTTFPAFPFYGECEHCENDLIRIRKTQNPAGDQEQKVIESCQQERRYGAIEGHKDARRGWFSRTLGKTANFKETQ